jgi:small subunit ribosomal protein S5
MIKQKFSPESWKPKTEIGRQVKKGDITNIDEVVDKGNKIMETEIVDFLLPDLDSDFMLIGQAKGKFGGGQRRLFRQTQKKTKEGNVPSFATFGVVGNKDGFVGVSMAKSKETVPARDKSIRLAKLHLIKVRRGCGSWQCNCATPHSIPFEVSGRCGSVEITLIPAPKGTGLCVEKELQKMLKLAGIKDVWSRTKGHTKTKINLIYACFEALKQLMETKISKDDIKKLGIQEGRLPKKAKEAIIEEPVVPELPKKKPLKKTPKKEAVKDGGK